MTNSMIAKFTQAIFKLTNEEATRLAYELSLLDTNNM